MQGRSQLTMAWRRPTWGHRCVKERSKRKSLSLPPNWAHIWRGCWKQIEVLERHQRFFQGWQGGWHQAAHGGRGLKAIVWEILKLNTHMFCCLEAFCFFLTPLSNDHEMFILTGFQFVLSWQKHKWLDTSQAKGYQRLMLKTIWRWGKQAGDVKYETFYLYKNYKGNIWEV